MVAGAAQDFTTETKINKFLQEIVELRKSNRDSARLYANEMLRTSQVNGEYKLGQLYYWTGELLLDHAKYDSAGIYYTRAIPYLEKDKDELFLGRAYIGAGYILNFKTRVAEAMTYDLKAEKIFRKLGDKRWLARSLKRIGDDITNQDEARATDAKPYYLESIALCEQEKDTLNIVRALNALVTVYTLEKNFEAVDEAMTRAVFLAEKIKCLRCQAISYSQWGVSDFKQGLYKRAIEKYRKEFVINKKLGADYDQFFVYQNISESLLRLKQFEPALHYSDSALRIAETDKAWNHYHDVYTVRYETYKGKGDWANSLHALEKKMQFKDSIFSEEKERVMEDMKASYDVERKEQQITKLEQQNTIKDLEATTARQWQIGLFVFLILLSIVVAVLYNRYQLKQRTAKTLNEKNNELQKLNGFKDRMFAVISHDLRNPVDAFSTIIESLNQNLQHASQEELKEFLESTLQSAKDLKSLLNNLLEWSLVQIGKLPFNPTTLSISDVVNESSAHIETMAVVKKIRITNKIETDKKIRADRSMITIVMRNLLSNAVKFSPEGKTIELSAQQSNGTIKIAVKDGGIGMNPEEIKKLFKLEENTRTIGNSTEKGAGIGLLLCKELIERNHGSISVESQPGVGSTFYLELPSA